MNNYIKHEIETAKWIRENGMDSGSFNTTHIRLLKAQQTANSLLKQHADLLTQSQQKTLIDFQCTMRNRHARAKLKPEAANPILNISSKINRKLFKQYRQLDKA